MPKVKKCSKSGEIKKLKMDLIEENRDIFAKIVHLIDKLKLCYFKNSQTKKSSGNFC